VNKEPLAIWFVKYKSKTGEWENGVYIAEIVNGKLKSRIVSERIPLIEDTLRMVDNDQCKELPGTTGHEEP
jgi:hypothetical protein